MSSKSDMKAVGILGCTGLIGQRFVALLSKHPFLSVGVLGASSRTAGRSYKEALNLPGSAGWRMEESCLLDNVADMPVVACTPKEFRKVAPHVTIVMSALDSQVAGEIEAAFVQAGYSVFSNASHYRMHPKVPLVVPTANPEHLQQLIAYQRQFPLFPNTQGTLVCNANCSTTGLVVVLKALHEQFGISTCLVTTLQSASGAGYPGCPALDLIDNVVPHIQGEVDKLETEPQKILGTWQKDHFEPSGMRISASVNRVAVSDGHLIHVSVGFDKRNVTLAQVKEALSLYKVPLNAWSMPKQPIILVDAADRPQPRLDRHHEMSVVVGQLRRCNVLDFKFTCLVHNTVLGAAGSAILNTELFLLSHSE